MIDVKVKCGQFAYEGKNYGKDCIVSVDENSNSIKSLLQFKDLEIVKAKAVDKKAKAKAEKKAKAKAEKEAEKLEAEKLEAEKLEAEKLEAEKLEAEKLEAEKLEAEKLEAETKQSELDVQAQAEEKALEEANKLVE